MCFISLSSAPRFNTYCPTTQPSSSMTLLDLCLTVDTFCVPKKTAEEYTAIPDIPALRTSYPGLDEVEGGEEEIWTLWIPSKASISYLSGCAEIHQMLLDSSWDDLVCGRMTLTCVGIKHLRCRKQSYILQLKISATNFKIFSPFWIPHFLFFAGWLCSVC